MSSVGCLRRASSLILVALLLVRPARGEDVRFQAGIVFAEPAGETLKLNLARPLTGTGPLPADLCIHGGGFSGGHREDYDDLCRKLARRGYVAVTIDYRLAPKHRWPAQIHDCKAAVRWLRTHAADYEVDPEKIAAMGSSAGGHLAQFLGMTGDVRQFDGDTVPSAPSSKVTCVAARSQASDFTREYGVWKGAGEAYRGLLGAELSVQSRKLHVRASPLFWVTPNAAPTLLVHGTADRDVLFVQSVWIYERLVSAEVDAELFAVEGRGHGLTGAQLHEAEQTTFRFFDRQFALQK